MSILYAQNESLEAENLIKKSQEALVAKNYIDASKALQKAKEEVSKLLNNQLTASLPAKFENWVPVTDSKASNPMGMPMAMPIGMPGSSDMSGTKIYEMEQNAGTKNRTTLPTSVVPPAGGTLVMPAGGTPVVPPAGGPVGTSQAMPNGVPPAMPPGATPGMPPAMPPGMNMPGMAMDNEKPRIIATISNNVMVAANVATFNSGGNANPMMAVPMGTGEDTKALKIKNYRALSKYNKMMKSGEVDIIVGAAVVQIQGNNIENSDVLQKFADQIDYLKIKAVFGE